MSADSVGSDSATVNSCETRMRDEELIEWANMLYDMNPLHNPKWSRTRMIQDLLDHSGEDHMAIQDKIDCRRAIRLIKDGKVIDEPHYPDFSVVEDMDHDIGGVHPVDV